MSEMDFSELMRVRELKHELTRVESKRTELLARIRKQEALIVKLEVELEMEEQDVEKLTRMSLTNLFHTILRSKREQLELERQQALAAALRLQEAKTSLAELQQELVEVGRKLAELSGVDREYEQLMSRKEAALREMPQTAGQLQEMDEEISTKSLLRKEIGEALSAGKGVMSLLTDASDSLQKAENWGNWDMWANGGMISTHIKHGHVDDAKNFIHHANRQLQDFHKELADLKQSVDVQVDISGTLKMADYWFDGLITDWIVQGRINNAQEQTLEALHQVRMVVNALEADFHAVNNELSLLEGRRVRWIEENGQ